MSNQSIHTDPSDYDPEYPPGMHGLRLPSHDAHLLGVLYTAAGPGPHPTLMLLHGFPGNERNFDLAQIIRRTGWHVLVFHYRGSWGSEGAFSFRHVLEDTRAVLDYLREKADHYAIDPDQIVLAGHSMGGWAALMSADERVAGVASIAGWNAGAVAEIVEDFPEAQDQLRDYFAGELAPLQRTSGDALRDEVIANGDKWNLLQRATVLTHQPVLLVAGKRDTGVVPFVHHTPVVNAFEAAGATQLTEVWLDSDHIFSDKRIALAQTLLDWLATL